VEDDMNATVTEDEAQDMFRRTMAYVTERACADGLEENVLAALFDVLDDAAQRTDPER
jgi:hypothetical protein